jgi:hypothetical protein
MFEMNQCKVIKKLSTNSNMGFVTDEFVKILIYIYIYIYIYLLKVLNFFEELGICRRLLYVYI